MSEATGQEQQNGEPDLAEGYPELGSVFSRILEQEDIPKTGVRRIEVNCFASGEATCRVWIVGLEDPEGAYLP